MDIARKSKPEFELKDYKCELCDLVFNMNIITKVYYEDDRLIIVDCLSCHIPMVVFKSHMREFEEPDIAKIHFFAVDRKWFNGKKVDYSMKGNREHAHAHLR